MVEQSAARVGASSFRLSTDDYAPGERVAVWREFYGRKVLRLEMEPLPDIPFSAEMTVQVLPGLAIATGASSLLRVGRSRELLDDGDDGLLLQVASSAGIGSQLGREAALDPGDAILFSSADVGHCTFPGITKALALRLPRSALTPLLRAGDDVLVRRIPKHTPALQLLVSYLSSMREGLASASLELQQLVVDHVRDLLAVALGATRDAAEIANGRGVRVARLRTIKAYIAQNLERGELSLDRAAAGIGVTPRYVQMLFAAEGMTFSKHVLSERLARVYRRLTDPALSGRSVADLAFEVGFGDLSYFNRTFRRHYGATPSDIRAGARRRE
jgi:AraC-like DNA-binding protein